MPYLSIITATYNGGSTLLRLLNSCANQTSQDFELIIQDNFSTDDTGNIIQNFKSPGFKLKFFQEADTGIYDAWNKALNHAEGQWIQFLGADDYLSSPETLHEISTILQQAPKNILYLASSLNLCLPNGEIIEQGIPQAEPISSLPVCMPVPHPALYHKHSLFKDHKFNPVLKIAGDYDFLAQTLKHDNFKTCHFITVNMSLGGISASLPALFRSELELLKCSRKNFPQASRLKLYLRLLRSWLAAKIWQIAGPKNAALFADFIRQIQGKPKLWSKLIKDNP